MNRINLANPENLVKIVVQTKSSNNLLFNDFHRLPIYF